MENNKKDPSSIVDGIMEDILKKINLSNDLPKTDLNPDAQPPKDANSIHPDELEQIVQETLAENWGKPEAAEENSYFETPAAPVAPVYEEPVAEEVFYEDEIVEEADEEESFNDAMVRKLNKKTNNAFGLWGIPHIISTVIWLFLIVAIGVSLGRTVWLCATDLLALGKEGITASITIADSDDIGDVAVKLKDAGLIEYPNLFEMFTKLTGKGENILRGTITFNNPENTAEGKQIIYDYNALINAMSYRGSKNVEVEVMIPEGYNCAQIFALLEKNGVCSAAALEKYAAEGELEPYWFLDGVERGHKYCLEGYLFPDTYKFYRNDDAEHVIGKLLAGFNNRFSSRMIDKMVAFNTRWGTNYTIRDFVIMASIIEKETSSDVEGYTIASVFYNRLRNAASYPFLQSDATIKYDVDYRSKGELITNPQINSSPYNTYTHKGLTPGPISNPGLTSLDAALDPEETDYFFFIFDEGAGMHRFSKTLAEHSDWARKLGIG